MQTNPHLVASACSVEALTKLIARYFYGSTIRIEGALIYNANGWLRHYQVRLVKGGYRFERLPEDTPDPDSRQFQEPPPTREEIHGYSKLVNEVINFDGERRTL